MFMEEAMKKYAGLLLLALLVMQGDRADAFYSKLGDEPFVLLTPAYSESTALIRASFQHHYLRDQIYSANFAAGIDITADMEASVKFLYHKAEITSGAQSALASQKEFSGEITRSLMKQKQRNPFDMSLGFGLSSFSSSAEFLSPASNSDNFFVAFKAVLSKKLRDRWLFNVSPAIVYDSKAVQYSAGICTGAKFFLSEDIAFFSEFPVVLAKPDGFIQPWSLGAQFKAGPHIITGFITAYAGSTLSHTFRGGSDTLYGFRFAF